MDLKDSFLTRREVLQRSGMGMGAVALAAAVRTRLLIHPGRCPGREFFGAAFTNF